MNINYLIEFIYLAEIRSFRKTADYFYVSRSVISRHIAAMEETVGVRLVSRGSKTVELTEAGKVFYREAQGVLRAYADAVDRTREVGRTMGRTVRIGYLKNAARPVIVRFARFMSHEHPNVHLDMSAMEFSELHRALEEDRIDVAIAINVGPEVSRGYRSTLIYTDRFYALVAKDHPFAGKPDGVSFDELKQEKLLIPESFVYAGMCELVDRLAEGRHAASPGSYYRDTDMLYLKVQAERYVGFSSGLNNAMFGDSLVILPITDADSSFTVSAFYAEGFTGATYDACRKGFEACGGAMANWNPTRDDSIAPTVAGLE